MPATLKPTKPAEQTAAMDVLIRAALTNDKGPLTVELQNMLGTLPREAGKRVATILVMLAGAAVADTADWQEILNEHLAGSAATH